VLIIYKYTKHYNYIKAHLTQTYLQAHLAQTYLQAHLAQTYLQASKLLKTHVYIFTQTQKLLKMPSSLKLGFN
jgi:hypothetical protein